MKEPLITNIQRYSIHDGKGTRTTVFFKGCPLKCRWCHNPETQSFANCPLIYEERCGGCGECVRACPRYAVRLEGGRAVTDRALCISCGACLEECANNAREICARTWPIPDLVKELLKDRIFYETSGGGVTLSGGEALAQDTDYLEELMGHLFRRGISVNIDTCGEAPWEKIQRLLPYTDTFLYDVKLLGEEAHRHWTGCSNRRILENLKLLSAEGANLWIRIPVVGGVNDTREEIRAIGGWLEGNRIRMAQANLLPYHNTGSGKYARLGQEYGGKEFYTPSGEKMEELRGILAGYLEAPVYVGG